MPRDGTLEFFSAVSFGFDRSFYELEQRLDHDGTTGSGKQVSLYNLQRQDLMEGISALIADVCVCACACVAHTPKDGTGAMKW